MIYTIPSMEIFDTLFPKFTVHFQDSFTFSFITLKSCLQEHILLAYFSFPIRCVSSANKSFHVILFVKLSSRRSFLFTICHSPAFSVKRPIYQHNICIFWPRRRGCVWSPLLETLLKTGFCSKSSGWWYWLHLDVMALWLGSASPAESFFAFSCPPSIQTPSPDSILPCHNVGEQVSCPAHARIPRFLHQHSSWFEKCLTPPGLLILELNWRKRFWFLLPSPA